VETGISENGKVEINSKAVDLLGKTIITKNPYPVLSAMKNTAEAE
jgi:hypothetical protein